MTVTRENLLGSYLRDRRSKLDPAVLGFPLQRRRTPGLRREEVAQRAHVSATWYTWLEQGRGGAPSAEVLERLARALMLTEVEREHLFVIALDRLPDVRFQAPEGVTPRLQRVLDALETAPAFLRAATWDIVAWNRAATVVLGDYAAMAPAQRNSLRLLFGTDARARLPDWEHDARFVVAAFRADVARSGATKSVEPLVAELRRTSPEFDAIWRDNDVRGAYGERPKRLRHPVAGRLSLEVSSFAVDGRPDLGLVVYHPSTPADAAKIRALLAPPRGGAKPPR